jgi:hypothetical protein
MRAQKNPPAHSASLAQKKRVQYALPSPGEDAWQKNPCSASQSALSRPSVALHDAPQSPGPGVTVSGVGAQNALAAASLFTQA